MQSVKSRSQRGTWRQLLPLLLHEHLLLLMYGLGQDQYDRSIRCAVALHRQPASEGLVCWNCRARARARATLLCSFIASRHIRRQATASQSCGLVEGRPLRSSTQ